MMMTRMLIESEGWRECMHTCTWMHGYSNFIIIKQHCSNASTHNTIAHTTLFPSHHRDSCSYSSHWFFKRRRLALLHLFVSGAATLVSAPDMIDLDIVRKRNRAHGVEEKSCGRHGITKGYDNVIHNKKKCKLSKKTCQNERVWRSKNCVFSSSLCLLCVRHGDKAIVYSYIICKFILYDLFIVLSFKQKYSSVTASLPPPPLMMYSLSFLLFFFFVDIIMVMCIWWWASFVCIYFLQFHFLRSQKSQFLSNRNTIYRKYSPLLQVGLYLKENQIRRKTRPFISSQPIISIWRGNKRLKWRESIIEKWWRWYSCRAVATVK